MRFRLKLIVFFLILVSGCFADIIPTSLKCEYRENPVGIDEPKPRFSWVLESNQRNQGQTAFQIICAGKKELLQDKVGDLWDSGKVNSDQTVHVVYNGKPFQSNKTYYWKVKVWDSQNRASEWSEPESFTMGLLNSSDWQAKWIQYDTNPLNENTELHLPPCPYLRKDFTVQKKVQRAFLYVSALGLVEMSLNGQKVGNDFFTPGWTDYNKRVYYFSYDVTPLINSGENVIGAILAEGWFADYIGYSILVNWPQKKNFYGKVPALLAQLVVEYADGSQTIIKTDDTWKAATGPIKEASILMGETFDARLKMDGWNTPGFNDKEWTPVQPGPVYYGKLQAFPGVPVRETQEIKPTEITEPRSGVYIFNMGQNFAGRVRLNIKGEVGTKVTLRFGEMLHQDGTLMTENLRKARATDTYILRGDAEGEVWEPQFTYHGFQYVELTGLPNSPDLETLTGIVLNSNTPRTGFFECSNDTVNKLYSNIVWTQRANYFDVPTDCPQRDERLGWTGDAQIYTRSASYNMDIDAFFTKWLRDLNDAQDPKGYYPNFAPVAFHRTSGQHYFFSPGWMDAGIICPYTIYQVYQDKRVLEHYYDNMKKQIEFYGTVSENYTCKQDIEAWGDWLSFGSKTSNHYIATAYYAYDTLLMSEVAAILGKDDDSRYFKNLFTKIQNAFLEKYWKSEGIFVDDSQTTCAMAIYMKLLPEDIEKRAAVRLAELIRQNGNRLSTGFIGCKHLLPALSEHGYDDLAYTLLTSTEFPSWGYEVVNNATTIWERWDSYTIKDGFKKGMNSFSHYAFGAVCEWMFRYMAGIDMEGYGFKNIIIRPRISRDKISYVNADYNSIHGKISSHWQREGNNVKLDVTIPANTTALVYVPSPNKKEIFENGTVIGKHKDIKSISSDDGCTVVQIGSGPYKFSFNLTD